jgi:hypothetical protein
LHFLDPQNLLLLIYTTFYLEIEFSRSVLSDISFQEKNFFRDIRVKRQMLLRRRRYRSRRSAVRPLIVSRIGGPTRRRRSGWRSRIAQPQVGGINQKHYIWPRFLSCLFYCHEKVNLTANVFSSTSLHSKYLLWCRILWCEKVVKKMFVSFGTSIMTTIYVSWETSADVNNVSIFLVYVTLS